MANLHPSTPLKNLIAEAWRSREAFDLRGVGYGKVHWGDGVGVYTEPLDYYFFLAAMVRLTDSRRIVEVGTHHGGSAKALAAGLPDPDHSRIVTFDTTPDGAELLKGHPVITAICED